MSDHTHLKALLRDNGQGLTQRDRSNAANAIDALERERDVWREKHAHAVKCEREQRSRAEAAEAKAKRLEEALQNILDSYEAADLAASIYHRARAALQEDKSHE